MRIIFRQTGGFTGLTLTVEVEERELSPEAAAEARRLLRRRATSGRPGGERAPRRSADVLAYEITITERRRRITLQFDALDVPAEAHALVDELREAATGEGPPSMNQPRRGRTRDGR
jgi:hypothetical protein